MKTTVTAMDIMLESEKFCDVMKENNANYVRELHLSSVITLERERV